MFDIIKAADIAEKLEEERIKNTIKQFLIKKTIRESLEEFGFQSLANYKQANNKIIIDEANIPKDSLLLFGYDDDLDQTPEDYLPLHMPKKEKDSVSILYQKNNDLEEKIANIEVNPILGFLEFAFIAVTDKQNYDIALPIAKPVFNSNPSIRDVHLPLELLNIAYVVNTNISSYLDELVKSGLINPPGPRNYTGFITSLFPLREDNSALPNYNAMEAYLIANLS